MADVSMTGLEGVLERLARVPVTFAERANAAGEEIGAMLVQYARNNHPWTVQTGMTNATTAAETMVMGEQLVIILSAGMDYDVYLELARGGKWAWLRSAALANKERILEIVRRRMGVEANFGAVYANGGQVGVKSKIGRLGVRLR